MHSELSSLSTFKNKTELLLREHVGYLKTQSRCLNWTPWIGFHVLLAPEANSSTGHG